VRYLNRCRELAAQINHWAAVPEHNAYVMNLLRAYDHRMGFLTKLDDDTLLLQNPSS
jgi:hypothetical protein